jgi:hypothetical protein
MSTGDLKALLGAEKADALAATAAAKLSEERSRALDYYMGDMAADMPAAEGRSRAVSSDVADTIEGLMPICRSACDSIRQRLIDQLEL